MVSKRWTWPAALALLFAGLTNAHAHMHYCFDGQEPPAAVHVVDSIDHAHEIPGHHDGDAEHNDLDVDVSNQALAKACKHDLPAIASHVVWTSSLEVPSGDALSLATDISPAPNPRYLHPQPRGPPR
jgi:hypothetical protein